MKKRILIVLNKFVVGGIETTLLTLLSNINYDLYDVTLGIFCKGGELESKIPPNVKITYLLKKDISNKKITCRLFWLYMQFAPKWLINKKYIKEKYDIAIAYTLDFIYFIKGFKGKKVCWVHGDYFPFKMKNHLLGKLRKKLTIKYFNECSNIICCSEQLKTMLISFSNNTLKNVVFLRNPINQHEIIEKANTECNYHFDKSVITFITVGRLTQQKGYDRLIPIMAELHQRYSNFKLLIIGDGDLRQQLVELSKECNADQFVEFLGHQDNPFKYVLRSDVYVCSSYMEGYSTSISEAIILGRAIVSTNCGGSDQLLDNGRAGVLTDNDSHSLKIGIERLLKNKDEIKKLKDLSNKRRNQLFDINIIMEEILKVAF